MRDGNDRFGLPLWNAILNTEKQAIITCLCLPREPKKLWPEMGDLKSQTQLVLQI